MKVPSLAWLAAPLLLVYSVAARETPVDPFAFFQPDVTLTTGDRERLAGGETITRILPARDGQLAVFAATPLNAPPQSVTAWARSIDHRFSDPPVLSDLDDLVLDEGDLDALQDCTPGDCQIKLAWPEIVSLRALTAAPGGRSSDALQRWFREMVLRRVSFYRGGGLTSIWPYVDRAVPIRPDDALGVIVMGASFLGLNAHAVADDLVSYPYARAAPRDSVIYWSKEQIGGVATVTVTHLRTYEIRGALTLTLAAGVEVYASHYRTGSLTVVGIVGAGDARATYLVYVNRSQVDALRGVLGRPRRVVFGPRARREAELVLTGLRRGLERAAGN